MLRIVMTLITWLVVNLVKGHSLHVLKNKLIWTKIFDEQLTKFSVHHTKIDRKSKRNMILTYFMEMDRLRYLYLIFFNVRAIAMWYIVNMYANLLTYCVSCSSLDVALRISLPVLKTYILYLSLETCSDIEWVVLT